MTLKMKLSKSIKGENLKFKNVTWGVTFKGAENETKAKEINQSKKKHLTINLNVNIHFRKNITKNQFKPILYLKNKINDFTIT